MKMKRRCLSGQDKIKRPVYVLGPDVAALWFASADRLDKVAAIGIRQDYLTGLIALVSPDLLLVHLGERLRYHDDITIAEVSQAMESISAMQITVPARLDALCRAAIIADRDGLKMGMAVYLAEAEVRRMRLLTADRAMAASYDAAIHIRDYR